MRRWYIPTRTSSWSYNTICFCLSDWTYCTTSIFLYQKLGHHFPCFFRNDIGFPCWFFFKWFVWARTPFFAHSWWVICLRVVFSNASSQLWGRHSRLQLAGWLTPQLKQRQDHNFQVEPLCAAQAGLPVGHGRFYDPRRVTSGMIPQTGIMWFSCMTGRFDLFGKLSKKSCTM